MNDKSEMEAGVQPLDALMSEAGMVNHDVVAASPEPLTHKQVGKARKGRKLTQKLQMRVLAAWNRARDEKRELAELFTYRGR